MITLTSTSQVLRARLTAAAAATNPTFAMAWADNGASTSIGSTPGIFNGTTNVSLVPSPGASTQRVIRSGFIYNGDTAAATIIIEHYDGTNARIIAAVTLQPGFTAYLVDEGIVVTDGAGARLNAQGNASGIDYISGINMQWNSGTSVTFSTGAAWIQGLGQIVRINSDITLTSISLTVSTMYHAYLYSNAGVASIELSATPPASPYCGMARSKTGDSARRYVGSLLSDTAGNVTNFLHTGNLISYRVAVSGSPMRVLSAGTATTETSVSMSAPVPVTSRIANVRIVNTTPDVAVFGTSDDSISLSTGVFLLRVPIGEAYPYIALNSSQAFTYLVASAASGGLFVDTRGYFFER